MRASYEIGKQVEDNAREWFLSRFSCRLLQQNYRCRSGEIDLVFECGDSGAPGESRDSSEAYELVFVEVRGRTEGKGWVKPCDTLTAAKRKCLQKAANHFLIYYKGLATTLRFDLLTWNGRDWEHRPNISLTDT